MTKLNAFRSFVRPLLTNSRSIDKDIDDMSLELFTIHDIYRKIVSAFSSSELSYGHSTIDPIDDAAFLVLQGLNLPVHSIEMWLPCRLTLNERRHLLALMHQRVEFRKPVAYLLNGAYQQGEFFHVDERVLIPRSFIGEFLNRLQGDKNEGRMIGNRAIVSAERVLDMCTGSGCLAILAAKFLPQAIIIDAVDISDGAIEVAKSNVRLHNLEDVVHVMQGDLFDGLQDKRLNFYDLIICNPPYVDARGMSLLPTEYRHEPKIALDGGEDGMDVIHKVLNSSSKYLRDGGGLLLEIGRCRNHIESQYPNLSRHIVWIHTAGMDNTGEVIYVTKDKLLQYLQ